METRTITEVKTYKLILNPVYGQAEYVRLAAFSDDYDRLYDFYMSELTNDVVQEDGFFRYFRKGPLYNYNLAYHINLQQPDDYYGPGITYQWVPLDTFDEIKEYGYNGAVYV